MHVIDRRENPKSKSLGNRQRFMRRVRSHIREAVREAIRQRKVSDLASSERVSIRSSDLQEPSFHLDSGTGKREFVLPGNQGFQRGDRIRKPRGGEGGGGQSGDPDGDGEDPFVFQLTSEEFLDLFFEDLELPNLAKRKLKTILSSTWSRAGYASDGSPSRLNKRETMRRSLSRRIALGRPSYDALLAAQQELEQAEQEGEAEQAARLRLLVEQIRTRMRAITFLDKVDLRYNRFDPRPKATTQAVMFCLMDTSASMTESLKDLAKRFYMLLHLFLTRHYRSVEIVFVRHTYTASEVDEETFFHGRETGGTIVSSALEEMSKIIQQRYPVERMEHLRCTGV